MKFSKLAKKFFAANIDTGMTIAVMTMENTKRGIRTSQGTRSWKLRVMLYIVPAMLPRIENANTTTRNLPKPLAGSSIAASTPPAESVL